MPSIESVFPVVHTDRARYEQLKRDLGILSESDLNAPNEEFSAIHPEYGEVLLGARHADQFGNRDKLYGVMLLTTDKELYGRARTELTK